MSVYFSDDELDKIHDLVLIYTWAQKLFMTKMEIAFDSLMQNQSNNPIEHIKSRIKSIEHIAIKLHQLNMDLTAEKAREAIKDIAGIRIICSYTKNIYYLAEIIKSIPDTHVLQEKDYVSNPKPGGYRSYHIVLEIPVFYSGKTELIPVEVQLRTGAMDFWATLEHKVRYKYKEHIPKHLSDELVICAEKIAELDKRMFLIHDIISLINQDS